MTQPTPPDSTPDSAPDSANLEYRYYQYLRGNQYATTDALMAVLRWYLPYFEGFTRVLDIGCGHGEFLQLLEEDGHEAVGIDIDPAMVATCRQLGLTAYEGDAGAWLAGQTAQFDAIFSSNVIEHLDAQQVQTWIRQAYGALRPGGMLLIGTPNPESLIVQFHEFWRDPTHVRLYSRQLIEFFFADAGFSNIENGNNGAAAWDGIDQLLTPTAQPDRQPPAAMPVFDPANTTLHPLPSPPPATAPLRQRLAFRLLHFVYGKFLEPYVALIRSDQARQNQQITEMQALIRSLYERNGLLEAALEQTNARLDTHVQQLGNGFRFMHPPREHFVYGYKPTTEGDGVTTETETETETETTTAATGMATTTATTTDAPQE